MALASQKRLAFYRQAQTHTTPPSTMPYATGIPNSLGSTLRDHSASFNAIGNSGNMIHRMAMIQLLDFDREKSCQVNLLRLLSDTGNAARAAAMLENDFDGLVITMSNIFRPGAKEPGLADLLECLNIPIYCVGAGLQDELAEGDISLIDEEIIRVVRVLDKKAVLFGVRGEKTRDWVRTIGLKNVQAIGCPSMFAYPSSIMSIKAPAKVEKVISAGHVVLSKSPDTRTRTLMRAFRGVTASYVFQGETRNFKSILDVPGVYNEATQQVDSEVINRFLKKELGTRPIFSKYYSFTEVAAWRHACMQYDLYAGDRIHGGVAAMQAGVPALVLYADLRVDELTSHHGIPSCTLDEFAKIGCHEAVEKYLNDEAIDVFKAKYREAFVKFRAAIEQAGLSGNQAWKMFDSKYSVESNEEAAAA